MSLPTFQRYQAAFCAHVRDPSAVPRPAGVPAQRMRVYRELLFNNMQSTLSACFPVCRRVLGVRRWHALVRRFFAEHRCATPLFRQIPEEFLRWMERADMTALPPFLWALAHYEWIELALAVAEADPPPHDPAGDLLACRPVLAPARALVCYDWPVSRISPRRQPQQPLAEPCWMLVFRDSHDEVRFMELNAVTARVVALLQEGDASGSAVLRQVAQALRHHDMSHITRHGLALLEELRRHGAILGTAL